ncbi:MAG TPA: hypothetical protein DDY26_06980 [Moraxellaceae bacterium]|nr:hypothetical protein [Moraxellaceae bacterium]
MQGGVVAAKNSRSLRIYAIISKMAINIYRFYLPLNSHDSKLVYQGLSMLAAVDIVKILGLIYGRMRKFFKTHYHHDIT